MSRILITGANSFIGTNFIKCSQYKEVKEISLHNILPENINFRNIDVVLHLAAIVHKRKTTPQKSFLKINRDLCVEVATQAKKAGVRQFIFLSTAKVYGKFIEGSEPWNEDSVCHPADCYGRSKYEAELLLRELEDENFTVSIIRTPIVYGYGVKANMRILIKLIEHCRILPFGKIENTRNFTYIENLTAYIDRIMEKRSSGTFIAIDDKPLSSTDLTVLLLEYLNKKVTLFRMPALFIKAGFFFLPGLFGGLFGSFKLDNTKTKKRLDFSPPYTIEEGLKRMIMSYKSTD